MIIGHIGVRKNSKGVIGKNFKKINGKPLIDWSLDQLLRCEMIDHVVVSTDCNEMHQHSLEKGGLDIGLRPNFLANDTAAKWDVWKHSLCEVEKILGSVDLFVDLDCTSPMREDQDIVNAIDLFRERQPDMVMSCCEAKKNPYFNLVEPDQNGFLKVSKKVEGGVVARQLAPLVLEHAASTYVVDPKYLQNCSKLFEGNVLPYIMPTQRCIDIDSELDYKIVEFLMKEKI
jgi:CMP-N,N'-diacetyllegionaminic acid synthase|tara:strand:- start:91 stop:780 length:690 start_codon:yes stop_codon:yes gene_type:complete